MLYLLANKATDVLLSMGVQLRLIQGNHKVINLFVLIVLHKVWTWGRSLPCV